MILSNALDTNGQNARYVRAAQRFGRDRKILSALAIGKTDPAGVIARFQMAAEAFDSLEIRSAHRAEQYFAFPNDIVWDRAHEKQIRELAQRADVIHLNNSEIAYKHFRLRKPVLLHHHGSLFRGNPERMFAVAKRYRMVQAVSTVDLLQADPSQLHWLPTAYPVGELAKFREEHRREPDGRVRIVHAPTNRTLKHTEVFLDAVRRLVLEGLPIDVVMVEGQTWAECMAQKATADIVFDQLAFGYGCNSVEAWAMGIPVISGSDEWTSNWMHREWGGTPYAEATPETLVDVLRVLITDKQARAKAAARGIVHVRRYHDEKPALLRLAELYRMAIETYHRERIPSKGLAVRFRNVGNRPIYDDDGQRVAFVKGEAIVDDPVTVERLRLMARTRPGYGIEEVA